MSLRIKDLPIRVELDDVEKLEKHFCAINFQFNVVVFISVNELNIEETTHVHKSELIRAAGGVLLAAARLLHHDGVAESKMQKIFLNVLIVLVARISLVGLKVRIVEGKV